ncbi:conserved hypothetical protein [Microbacterium sp. 8M]|jgi:tetrahydromethanopterin S-methyltransferase subunit F|uniref:DUF3040 domain-containing protein n=1 Tax=Microbacterium sp. 8M TaxID=2653153 RepID=UPI0012F471B7|nr:DUF3040 domain-containing protein [Microbacterium sp. 8M]VXC12211.1 conserved hypothetical protein [Microbacterium sp. 8M]
MPLSEQEQRLLDEMERHLMQNDADVVSAHAGDRALSYRNLIYGAVLLLAGVGGLIVGVVVGNIAGIIIGVVAFAAMLGGLMLALTPVRRGGDRETTSRTNSKEPSPSFMDRMNDRWDRRHEEH